jgi:hypothetical protein
LKKKKPETLTDENNIKNFYKKEKGKEKKLIDIFYIVLEFIYL